MEVPLCQLTSPLYRTSVWRRGMPPCGPALAPLIARKASARWRAPEQGVVILQSWLAPASVQAGMNVRGLTTAASTWGVAALGMLAGVGFYRLAIGLTVFVVAVELLSMLERRLPTHSAFSSKLKFREGHRARVQEVREYLSVRGLRLPPDDAEVQPSALRDGGADLRQREALGLDERGRHGVVVAPGRRVLRDDALQSRINA